MFPDVLEIELGSSSSGKSSDGTHKVALFGYRVNYNHDGVRGQLGGSQSSTQSC